MRHYVAGFSVLALLIASQILAGAQSPAPGTTAVTGAWAGAVVFKADDWRDGRNQRDIR